MKTNNPEKLVHDFMAAIKKAAKEKSLPTAKMKCECGASNWAASHVIDTPKNANWSLQFEIFICRECKQPLLVLWN